MNHQVITETNRIAWDEAADVHASATFEKLKKGFATPEFLSIREWRREALLAHGLAGRAVCQICCNNGREILSVKRLGAGRCVGIDFSERFLEQGRQLAKIAGVECEFVQSDVYAVGEAFANQFDVVYIGPGTFCFMPDLDRLFAVIGRMLRVNGWLYVNEMHPVASLYGIDPARRASLWRKQSYFACEPQIVVEGLDYFRLKRSGTKPCYMFHHKLSDILQSCIKAGFKLETIEERSEDISGGKFRRLRRQKCNLPLNFVLTATHG